ncbi:hypothetical protein [Mogibacterium pumilum]|uniref:Uncharacterized protein n=1 Tax=Mogibacterium pumilum TaxID=86332 RepID=A0A223ARF7_9FIRM|nr:hypothetical protein [Mogibacterium pumilum]ASS37564.1 hypothetical protein AXF17_03220 [Mogibacterium pumilum]
MHKTMNLKSKIFIIAIIVIVSIIVIKKKVIDPQPVREIKTNMVYIGGSGKYYPKSNFSRYYIEFKDDKTYILMKDDSRRHQENYNEDGDGSCPEIEFLSGSYEIKNGNYVLTMIDIAGVEFKDVKAVKNKKINKFSYKKYKDGKKIKLMVILTKKGNYLLGYLDSSGKSHDEHSFYYWLYNKSDIKKLPSSVEEFRKQFKMDKKAEQERLTGQNQ